MILSIIFLIDKFSAIVLFIITHNVLGLCEVTVNRSEKFRFRRHVAKANFYLLNYEKKPIKLAFADYEAQNFNLSLNPPFCKTLVVCSFYSSKYSFPCKSSQPFCPFGNVNRAKLP